MKRLMISAFAAVAMLAAATTMLRLHTPAAISAAQSASTISVQELHSAPSVNNLPIEDVEDQSLVYPRTKQ
jgi:hypothetical protein